MNIIQLLKEKNVITQLKYYGPNDMATGMEVKILIENKEIIRDYYNNKKPKISNLNDYIDYLYLLTIIRYEEIIPLVREDLREEFTEQINYYKSILLKYETKDLNLFISKKYNVILNNEYEGLYIKHDILDYTIQFLCKFCLKDDEAIKFLISNFSYKIYDEFESFKKVFNKSKDLYLYDLLLTEDLMSKDMTFRLDKIEKVLLSLKIKNQKKYEEKLVLLINIVKGKTFNPDMKNVMSTYHEIKNTKEVLERLGYKEAYEFDRELKKQEKLLNEYLKKYGQSTSFEFSIKPFVDMYEDKAKEWYEKSISLTHSQDKKTKKLISNLEYTIKYFEKSQILDSISSNKSSDQIFTQSTINNLSISMMQGKYGIHYMISEDKRLNDLMGYIFAGINKYFGNNSSFYNSKDFEIDINMLFIGISEIKLASSEKNELKTKFLIYSTENLLCGIIEKTLRNIFYEHTKEEKYTSINNINLRFLLNEVKDIIGDFNSYCLDYYLLNRNGVGQNQRNDFAHFNESIYDKLVYDTILEETYLLLTISNILMIKGS